MSTRKNISAGTRSHSSFNNDPACRAVDISFAIIGPSVNPDAITKSLRLKPTTVNKRGEKYTTKAGRTSIHLVNRWCVESSRLIKSTSVEQNALSLLKFLEPKKNAIRRFAKSTKHRIVIRFKWEATDNHYGGFSMTSETMQRLTNLCSDMHFYFIGAKKSGNH